MIKDICFDCYSDRYSNLKGRVADECLYLDSYVYGDDYDSEKHYSFSKEETARLFSILTLDEFINLCQTEHTLGMERFLEDNNIAFDSVTI